MDKLLPHIVLGGVYIHITNSAPDLEHGYDRNDGSHVELYIDAPMHPIW